jgi:hypothetical protein
MRRAATALAAIIVVLACTAGFRGPGGAYTRGLGGMAAFVGHGPTEAAADPAVAIAMTNWGFATGGLNFVLSSGLFASPAQGHIRAKDMASGYVPSSAGTDVWDPAITDAGDSFTGMVVGHTYQFQYRAWTGTTGWESLPWLDLGTTWVQPNRSSAQEEQSG